MGYPIIAVLMILKRIDFDETTTRQLSGFSWEKIIKQFKRDYDKVIDFILQSVVAKGGKREEIMREVDSVLTQLNRLGLKRMPQPRRK